MATVVKINKIPYQDNDVFSKSPNKEGIKCYFCNGNHACRDWLQFCVKRLVT